MEGDETMAAIKKRSLVDQVYEMLRGDIITLRRPLGSKLNVNELQDELGVSCTPIREAVNRLQQEGLVVYENNVGAHILDLDQHDITEIEQLAMTLHCAAIRLAMAHGDRAAIVTGLEKYLEGTGGRGMCRARLWRLTVLWGPFTRTAAIAGWMRI